MGWMLLQISSALESVRNLRVTELAVEDVQKSAGMLSNRRELWKNAENGMDKAEYGDQCFYEECPKKCMDAAKSGNCLPECKGYEGNPRCCPGECPLDCQEKSLWGECLAKCKPFEGDPNCCAATCPAKCTNRRRKECSAGGIPECDNIPGCCAEHFDVVYGVGVYLPQGSGPGEV